VSQKALFDDYADDTDIFQILSIVSRWQSLDLEEKKQVAAQMIERVDITDESLQITWKKSFDVL
jgi:hypothetical protein